MLKNMNFWDLHPNNDSRNFTAPGIQYKIHEKFYLISNALPVWLPKSIDKETRNKILEQGKKCSSQALFCYFTHIGSKKAKIGNIFCLYNLCNWKKSSNFARLNLFFYEKQTYFFGIISGNVYVHAHASAGASEWLSGAFGALHGDEHG